MKSGIYKITNKINGKYYIGSSKSITDRWKVHRHDLRNNKHHSIYLQRAWNKYGEKNFIFEIIEPTSIDKLLIREESYLKKAKKDRSNCYNLLFSSDRHRVEESTRQKLSKRAKINYKDPKNNPFYGKHHNKETKKRLRKSHLGTHHSLQTIEKIRESNKGKNNGMYGKHHSEKTIQKIIEKTKDKTIYIFKNIITGRFFEGTRYDFRKKYNLNKDSVGNLIIGNSKSLYNWVVC